MIGLKKIWLTLSLLITVLMPVSTRALVDIETWQRPSAVTMMPRVENLRINPMILRPCDPAGDHLIQTTAQSTLRGSDMRF